MKKLMILIFVFTAAAGIVLSRENSPFDWSEIPARQKYALKVTANDNAVKFNHVGYNYYASGPTAEQMIEVLKIAKEKLNESSQYIQDCYTDNNPIISNVYQGKVYSFKFVLRSAPRRLEIYFVNNNSSRRITFNPEYIDVLIKTLEEKISLIKQLQREPKAWQWPEDVLKRTRP